MSLTRINHDHPAIAWEGAVSLERTEEYTRPWRVPLAERPLFHPELVVRASMPSGVRLRFRSSTTRLQGAILPMEENRALDLIVDGRHVGSADLAGKEVFNFADLPPGEKLLELWLPHNAAFALRHLEIDADASLRHDADPRSRWVTYGSSITQGHGAPHPSQTWPSIVARQRQLNLLCLGYAGQCQLDVQVARLIRDTPADFISICAGINIYGRSGLNSRTFAPALIGFVQIIREKHLRIPILLVSPTWACERETTPNKVGWAVQDYRAAVEEAASLLRHHGDPNLRYLSGLELLDSTCENLLPDKLHPSAEGYAHMAENFLHKAGRLLFGPIAGSQSIHSEQPAGPEVILR